MDVMESLEILWELNTPSRRFDKNRGSRREDVRTGRSAPTRPATARPDNSWVRVHSEIGRERAAQTHAAITRVHVPLPPTSRRLRAPHP